MMLRNDSHVHLHVFIAGDPKECHGHGISAVKGIQLLCMRVSQLMQGHNQGTNANWLQQEEKHPAWASECLQGPFHDHSKIEYSDGHADLSEGVIYIMACNTPLACPSNIISVFM